MKTLTIAVCCVAFAAGLAIFDVGCSMWFYPLGFMFGGIELTAIGLFIGRSVSDGRD